ncbi:type III-B CRISPR module RAMP protein Cmr6 [Pasteurella skyensis]|uniref:Type III-B CRISPR module RAMP protein Cmr6 n=1 Tax=Phocoenobacter skyensis TaxID=97481 RepID=A0AAJ6N7R4_9PAST|nr:type III-B CRISPR module RAMP protein Cmr6 [Pasteurella skyensis]MDP8161605.1 type III-B CRISPR module RAMP protein Cmr6 [Pasteurella skyensis]MDP8171761.1 type III-B CRISPR module RAMP protein Cmr6 [Pasteurella skyensis]MDP8175999.1 type III-B CRISPR module RAMP protein Cmr6 [Pasteurella skyensis]MDP8177967.1 type III-B CRISPR module RAMP protein Cmr6 [Pasteurella skyensis]MDP8182374.1 type III-B CRISPR module RAMP protein Cmr6 [Pasteurella skyensis]
MTKPNESNFSLYKESFLTSDIFSQNHNGNNGLLFNKFFEQYDTNWSIYREDKKTKQKCGKQHFLQNFSGKCGYSEQLEGFNVRQLQLIAQNKGSHRVYEIDGHFVTGMGNEHPVENGFLWHYTLGVPYLSGSQVKGLVRSLIEQYYQKNDKADVLLKWFGSEDKDPKKQKRDNQAGELIFFDAIPTEQPTLSVDIMTPHMGDWYAKGGDISNVTRDSDKIPADWHDPNPIPFLAVKEAKFLFTISKRPKSDIDIEDVFKCLDQALMCCGAGAKTQTGYGFMTSEEEIKRRQDEEKKQQQEEQDFFELFDEMKKEEKVKRRDFFETNILPRLHVIIDNKPKDYKMKVYEFLLNNDNLSNRIRNSHLPLINKLNEDLN